MPDTLPHRYKHPHPAVAVDLVIFTLLQDQLHLLLIERGVEPFQGTSALPGGFVRIEEDLLDAARRELHEETGISAAYLDQVGAFGSPKRDPRERVVSIAYFAIIPADKVVLHAGTDAHAVAWHPYSRIPPVAFDHIDIIGAARSKLVDKINRTTLALEFLPPEFTLTELQQVFEGVQGASIDKRNFRKWIDTHAFIKPTGRLRRGGQHRPAALYKPSGKGLITLSSGLSLNPQLTASSSAADYRRGFEDAVTAMHKAVGDAAKGVLRSVNPR